MPPFCPQCVKGTSHTTSEEGFTSSKVTAHEHVHHLQSKDCCHILNRGMHSQRLGHLLVPPPLHLRCCPGSARGTRAKHSGTPGLRYTRTLGKNEQQSRKEMGLNEALCGRHHDRIQPQATLNFRPSELICLPALPPSPAGNALFPRRHLQPPSKRTTKLRKVEL